MAYIPDAVVLEHGHVLGVALANFLFAACCIDEVDSVNEAVRLAKGGKVLRAGHVVLLLGRVEVDVGLEGLR